jgi:cofilin
MFKYILFTLNKEKTEVIVEKTSSAPEYDEFLADLPESECRWAVYDFEFHNEEGNLRNKIIFYSWYVPLLHSFPAKCPLCLFLMCTLSWL